MRRFIARHADKITGVLSGFDRLVFRGHLRPLCYAGGVANLLSGQGVMLKDFEHFVQAVTAMLRKDGREVVERLGRRVEPLKGHVRLEDLVRQILVEQPVRSGPICHLSQMESCSTWTVWRSRERKHPQEIRRRTSKCLHLYTYFLHDEFGLCYVRLQTWMPYLVQVYVNGREWLARQLDRIRMRYIRADNCLPYLADPVRAQAIFDGMLDLPWRQLLDDLVLQANPAIAAICEAVHSSYYWTIHQSEVASDVLFRDADELAAIMPNLVRHSIVNLDCHDTLRFLGKKRVVTCGGGRREVLTDFKRFAEGIRMKHSIGPNSQKMYDRSHPVPPVRGRHPAALRFENTTNDPSVFRARRKAQGNPDSPAKMRPLRKGIADMRRRVRMSQAANNRHADALAVVDSPAKVHDLIEPATRRVELNGRPVRALHPWAEPDLPLLRAVANGNFLLNGFRNRDLHAALFSTPPASEHERRRRTTRVSYLLRILRGHGIVAKVTGTHRYHVTSKGRELIAAVIAIDEASVSGLQQCA